MRLRLLAFVGLAIPSLAFAAPVIPTQAPPGQPPQQQPGQPGQPPQQQPGQQQPGQPAEPSPQERAAAERELLQQFEGKQNFRVEGTAMMVDPQQGAILIMREDMPPAVLIVPEAATVQVDGKKSSLAEIQPGSEVRATFNLAQQFPIAIRVEAKKAEGQQQQPGQQQPGRQQPPPGQQPGQRR
jgi:hypothetical protein